ncbi:hypothetical protein pipiens_015133 [Culex pipiens pipiens]|uniref:SET domain-containing protein n=1 Tax=Culex pipiens pipiens TaxID=38569 RepID=A0ABD1CRX1_CULPP
MDKPPSPKTTAGGHVPPDVDILLSRMLSEIASDADIEAYRDMVLANGEVVDVSEVTKSDTKAEQLRKAGNRLYHARKYKAALGKYNEAMCCAESEYDPLAEFKELHKTVLNTNTEIEGSLKACAALSYAVLIKNPAINSSLTTKSHHRFLLNSLLHYTRVACFLMWNSHVNLSTTSTGHVLSGLTSVGSLINHSCDPNVAAIYMGGRLKFILLRPIRAGEQILTAYGPTWYDRNHPPVTYSFVCACPFCVQPSMQHWLATGRELSLGAERNADMLLAILQDEAFNDVDKLHAIQQYIQRHIRFHPEDTLSRIMTTYRLYLLEMVKKDIERMGREAAVARVFE